MESAIFGLLGVIVGGLIAAGSSFALARRQERAAAERESRVRATELKRAARLIDLELAKARASAVEYIGKRRWWGEDLDLVTENWRQYCAILAPELSGVDWHRLFIAVIAVDQMRVLHAAARKDGLLYHTITDDASANMTLMLNDLVIGSDAIALLCEDR